MRRHNRYCDWATMWATEESPFCCRNGEEIILLFSKASRAAMGSTLASVEWGPETFSCIARESNLFMAKGHTRYSVQLDGPHMEKWRKVLYLSFMARQP